VRFADWIAERILFGKRGDVNGEIEQPSCHLAIDILTYEHVEDQSIEGGPPGNDLKYGCPRQKHGMSASASARRVLCRQRDGSGHKLNALVRQLAEPLTKYALRPLSLRAAAHRTCDTCTAANARCEERWHRPPVVVHHGTRRC
jgi:hypothetical protein